MIKNHDESIHKKLLFDVFDGKKVDTIPWIPFAGIHSGKLKGYSSKEVLTDADKLLESLIAVNKQYHPDGLPIMFDLQIEAEILGCDMKWVDKSPPIVCSHPLTEIDLFEDEKVPLDMITVDGGRIPMYLDVMRRLKTEVGDHTALFGLITGPLTIATHLRGTNFFMDLLKNKDYAKTLLSFCTDVAIEMATYYIDAGMDVIAVVDPVVSQVSPRVFKGRLSEFFSKIFAFVKNKQKYSSFFVCGDATNNLELMCNTYPDSIFVDENIDMVVAKRITNKYEIVLGGNIPLTTKLLFGSQKDNMKFVLDLLDTLEKEGVGLDRYIVAPGCDMPYDCPIDNAIGVVQTLREPNQIRKILKNFEYQYLGVEVEMPDYDNLSKPLIEVFTIDSNVCAACGYMKNMAMTATESYPDKFDFVEHKYTEKESVARAVKLGLEHLPALLINGKLIYSSIIPSQEEYFAELEKRL